MFVNLKEHGVVNYITLIHRPPSAYKSSAADSLLELSLEERNRIDSSHSMTQAGDIIEFVFFPTS